MSDLKGEEGTHLRRRSEKAMACDETSPNTAAYVFVGEHVHTCTTQWLCVCVLL